MALAQDTISINMATGINDKVDPKIAGPDQTATLKNARFTKDKRIEKRYGMTSKATTSVGAPTNTTAIGTSTHPTKVFEHENQLCQVNNGSLYSQVEGQDKWLFKGYTVPLDVEIQPVSGGANFFDTATVGGITASIGQTLPFTNGYGSLIVRENSTGVILKNYSNITNPRKLVTFSGALWVLWYDNAATALKAQSISLTDGSLGSAINLQSDALLSLPNKISVAMTTSSSLIGEAAVICYGSTTLQFKVFAMNSAGTVLALGKLSTGHDFQDNYKSSCNIYIEPTVNQNRFWLATSCTNATTYYVEDVYSQSWTFTASAYTSVYSKTVVNSFNSAIVSPTDPTSKYWGNMTQAIDPNNNTDLYVFADTLNFYTALNATSTWSSTVAGFQPYSQDNYLYFTVLNFSGSITRTATIYGIGYNIAANAIRDTQRNTIYIPCATFSELQSAIYLMDVLKGRSTSYYSVDASANRPSPLTYSHMKVLDGLTTQPQQINTCAKPSATSYHLINNGYIVGFDFAPAYAQQSQYFSKTTHLTGGLLWAYDGDEITEHNLFQGPEIVDIYCGQQYLTLTTVPGGKVWYITVPCAAAFAAGSTGAYGYVTYYVGATQYYIWFKIDGVGVNPAPAGATGQLVNLASDDSSYDVATKIAAVVGGQVEVNTTLTPDYYKANPAMPCKYRYSTLTPPGTGPAVAGFYTVAGTKSAGTYTYQFCYRWTDRNGNVYRSTTSVPQSVKAVANDRIAGLVWIPPVTNKTATTVYLECYRSVVDGAIPQLFATVALSPVANRYYFKDTLTDADIADNEVIYTTGGVLDNTSIGACKSVSFFKSRLVVTPVDDQLAVYYSKQAQANSPIDFSAELYFREDADKDPVTAAVQMDDKLIVYKPTRVYAHSGDGANDVGTGVTLSPAILIATDVGCSNPNSVILYPNGLMFKSQKGLYNLDRGLSTTYLGAAAEGYNANTVSGALLMENVTEIRFFFSDNSDSVVYNYFFNRWDNFTNMLADSVCMWRGKPVRITNAGVAFVETTNFYDVVAGVTTSYSLYWKSPWLKLKGIQDFQRIYEFNILGEYLSPHTINVSVQYDYDTTTAPDTYSVDAEKLITGTFPGDSVYQYQVNLIRQKCQSIQVTIEDTPTGGSQASMLLNDLAALVGLKRGLNKMPARKQT